MFNSVWDLLQKPIFTVSGQEISVVSVFYFLVIILISFTLARLIIRFLKRNVYSKMEIEKGAQFTLSRLVKYVIIVVGVLIGLQMLGVNLSILAFLGGLLGVGIGFGLQNVFLNFACGLILLFEKPVKVGDLLELNGTLGKVKDIGFRASLLETPDNETLVVPNSSLVTDEIKNLTHGENTDLRIHIPIGVAYGTDIEQVREILLGVVESEEKVLKDRPAKVVFKEHGDSALGFDLRVWIITPGDRPEVKNSIREKIDREFNDQGIEMPYPTRDVYLFKGEGEEGAKEVEQLA
ncbi:mechanosensitive ion channel [Candidatus Bipolaricaulota bacterium]|nr:mechanosensitive ion channel [Candidatus Bipolaricaulota bacterium]MBS3814737.1 mechanosensitive ion channel [Candidatus Bipolaricaulota bacterium]